VAGFSSSRGSIADRMKSLDIRDMLISKQVDPNAAMNVADPAAAPETGLVNPMAGGEPVVQAPPATMTTEFLDNIGTSLGDLASLVGQWPSIEAQLVKNEMPMDPLITMRTAMDKLGAELKSAQLAQSMMNQHPHIKTLRSYDEPAPAPVNMTAAAQSGVNPPMVDAGAGSIMGGPF